MNAYPPTSVSATGNASCHPRMPDETPLDEAATLYAQSPHAKVDAHQRARRARRAQYGERHIFLFGRSSKIREPMYLVWAVLVLGLVWICLQSWKAARSPGWSPWMVPNVPGFMIPFMPMAPPQTSQSPAPAPASASRGTFTTSTLADSSTTTTSPVVTQRVMPAQKTFTLASRGKGCHLVQSEVEREIGDMLRGVQVGILTLFIQHTSAALSLNENFDRDVRTDMDMVRRRVLFFVCAQFQDYMLTYCPAHRLLTMLCRSHCHGATQTKAPMTPLHTRRRR